MAKTKKTFQPGDRVAYAVGFLKSTGQQTGDSPFLRGEIVSVQPLGQVQLCAIRWTLRGKPYHAASQYHDDGLGRVIAPNLTLVSRIAQDAALAG